MKQNRSGPPRQGPRESDQAKDLCKTQRPHGKQSTSPAHVDKAELPPGMLQL